MRALRTWVIVGLLAGFALSPKLWLSSRAYPLEPVLPFLTAGSPVDAAILCALVALLLAVLIAPRKEFLAGAFGLLFLLALQDQSRWQPWFYQYVLMLLAVSLAGEGREEEARNTCRLIVVATYIWSGLSKWNPTFLGSMFRWLIAPLIKSWPAPAQEFANHLAFLAPAVEFLLGVGLLTRRFRRPAVYAAIAMHIFVLLALGPLGLGYNSVVWPWNLCMVAFLVILFLRPVKAPSAREIVWGRSSAFHKAVLAIFALVPALCFFGLWDDYLSSALYSGNTNSGEIDFNDAAFDKLPAAIQDYVLTDKPDSDLIVLDDWSLGELHVPAYPQVRNFRNATRLICRYTSNNPSVKLIVDPKITILGNPHTVTYGCSDLRTGPRP